MSTDLNTMTCSICGATVYREQLEEGIAARRAGKVYCSYCLAEADGGAGAGGGGTPEAAEPAARAGATTILEAVPAYGRPYATRVKTFHCKLAPGPLEHLDDQINEWADSNPEIQIKFATTTVGVVEGKHNDPHLLVSVFY